jgi:chromosome segregation ATPase
MPTPDKTIDDVSKLVSVTKRRFQGHQDIAALCDALESVAKERDEKAEAIENLCGHIAELAESREDLIAERDKVAKERDALREAGAKIVEGFNLGILVRSIEHDHEPMWALKLAPYLKALTDLQESALASRAIADAR